MVNRRVLPVGFIEPCVPILAAKPPTGPQWVHEIKHDGYRLIVRRDGARVRVFTRRGYDWTEEFSAIAAAAAKVPAQSFTIDGEAVVTGPDGVAAFDELHGRNNKVHLTCSRIGFATR
jgi:bifunctional non-homologous end joining protein LigD